LRLSIAVSFTDIFKARSCLLLAKNHILFAVSATKPSSPYIGADLRPGKNRINRSYALTVLERLLASIHCV